MAQRNSNPVLLVLAVIGGIALILVLGSWLGHGSMTGGGMMGGSTSGHMGGTLGGTMGGVGAGVWVLGLLAVAGVVAVILIFARRNG